MRVLLCNSFFYRRGGAESHFLDLIGLLEGRGHEVAVLSMVHPDNLASRWKPFWASSVEFRQNYGGYGALRAAARVVYSAESYRAAVRLVSAFRPEVAHLHGIHHHLSTSVVSALDSRRVPVVWTLHDYRIVCPATARLWRGSPCSACRDGRIWHCVYRRCKSGSLARSACAAIDSAAAMAMRRFDKVDCFVAPSRFLASELAGMGFHAKRLEVLPNFYGLSPQRRGTGERWGVLYVGRLSPEKGVDVLIRAMVGIPRPLYIVGEGPDESRLRRTAGEAGVDARFFGRLDHIGVRSQMDGAELLCLPSICYENCPITVLEAMDRELPVVGANSSGIAELLKGGAHGWLAGRGDVEDWHRVLMNALCDKRSASSRALAARAYLEKVHAPSVFTTRLEAIYRSVARDA